MKYALMILIAVVLLVGEGCSKSQNNEVISDNHSATQPGDDSPREDIQPNDTNPAEPDLSGEITPFDEAKCRASAKKWVKDAEGLLEEALEADDDVEFKIWCLENLATIQGQTGKTEAAIKNFGRAAKLASKHLSGDKKNHALAIIASFQAKVGLYDHAAKTDSEIEGKFRGGGYRRIVRHQIEKKDFAAAKRTAEQADLGDIYLLLAETEAEAGLYENAKETAALALKISPADAVEAFARIAMHEVQSGNERAGRETFAHAKEILEKNETIPNKTGCYSGIALAEGKAGMLDVAVNTLRKVEKPYSRYFVWIAFAELAYQANDQQKAGEFLKYAKEDAAALYSECMIVRGLCEVAVAESKFVGRKSARKTLDEAYEICKKVMHSPVARMELIVHTFLRGEFDAGFRKEAEATAKKECPSGSRQNWGLAKVAELYARAGEFEETHRILRSIDNDDHPGAQKGFYYEHILGQIARIEICAGNTKYVQELAVRINEVSEDETYEYMTVASILGQSRLETAMEKRYKEIANLPPLNRFYFCVGAASGLLEGTKIRERLKAQGSN